MPRPLRSRISYRLFITILCSYAMLNIIFFFMADQMEQISLELRSYVTPRNLLAQTSYYSTERRSPPLVTTSTRAGPMKSKGVKQRIPMKVIVNKKQASGQIQYIDGKIRTQGQVKVITQKPILSQDFIGFLNLNKPGDSLINTQNFTFSLDSDTCQKASPFALIFVHSAVRNREQRQVIRTTWGGVKSYRSLAMATVFLVGLGTSGDQQVALETEAAQYGDLVQGPFLDTYRNLTYKHVMGLVWAWRHCPQAMYVVKVDDDTLVNPYLLLTFLKDVGVPDRVIYCRHFTGVPHRHKNKWQVTMKEYPFPKYPSYCEGFGYVLKRQTGKLLVDAARTSKFFWVDDVYVTGLLRIKAGVLVKNFHVPFGFAHLSKKVLEDRHSPKVVIFFRGETRLSETHLQGWKLISNSFALTENKTLMLNESKNH